MKLGMNGLSYTLRFPYPFRFLRKSMMTKGLVKMLQDTISSVFLLCVVLFLTLSIIVSGRGSIVDFFILTYNCFSAVCSKVEIDFRIFGFLEVDF